MPRGRAPARGTRRAGAAAGQRAQNETGESSSSAAAETTAGPSGTASAPRSASVVPARGGATTRATRGPAPARFRPKVVRRDEAERDTLARQEEKKAQDRAADEKRARGRSRFRSKRSRGDAMGSRGGFGRIIGGASGPFSSGTAGGGGGWGGGWGGGGGGGSFGGSIPRSFKSDSKPGFGQANRYREARINADKLNVQTQDEELDSEDEAMMAALGSRSTAILPMGIYRKEHKDEGIVVATTAELEAAENAKNATGEEESLWVDDSAPQSVPSDESEDGGVWKTDGEKPTVIKKEPDDSMDLDVETKPATEVSDAEKGKVKSQTPQAKAKKVVHQDPEEKIIDTDLNLLASELGTVTITEKGEDGEENKLEDVSNKDGRLYLFQFPPILPPLKPTSQPKPANKVKAEPEDFNALDSTPAATGTPVDLTMEEMQDDEEQEDPEETLGFLSQFVSQGGLVGQLKVRKSGRVEMDWGGQILEMSPAAGMNFLTTAVIVEENDEKPKPGVVGGESIGMGKIMGRFVLAPTWEEEEDWDVSPEELRID
ncbi:RNA polymerase III RPC4-domain-containing protein [Mariannaea sp. PMI_226]|nr:RNA polymerase III RPC4-domain-containing protein [Mariannaea sp. PMI_226]